MTRIFTFSFLLVSFTTTAQFQFRLDNTVPVEDATQQLLISPWTGGLNAAEYNTMDLNADGEDDLVLFDRMAQKVITFLAIDNQYVYSPAYEAAFPTEILNWVLLRDYNNDGKKDLFTGDLFGIRVFTNVTTSSFPEWELFHFYVSPTSSSDVLLSQGLSGLVNVQLQFDDMPSISDLDGDGDLDIICMKFGSAGTLEYHKNLSIENYGRTDTLSFKLMTQAWGGVRECECGQMSFNNGPCKTPGGAKPEHAGGKSLTSIDFNGDSHQDLLISEGECTTLYAMENEGTADAPVINDFTPFPIGAPAIFSQYPAAYFEDVDFDGVKDLMVTPNCFTKDALTTNFRQSNWFYKNTGTNSAPSFTYIRRDFLQNTMLDVGDNAVPAFGDVDGDLDYDLLISNNDFPARIFFYENIGSASAPEFKFVSPDYAGLQYYLFRNMKIQLADVNGDFKTDLVFTATSAQSGTTGLYYVPNRNYSTFNFAGQAPIEIPFAMASTENVTVTDVDGDGKPDVLKGKSNGALEYWRNTGSMTLTLEDPEYLGIGPSVFRTNQTVKAADLNSNGKPELILSDQTGKLRIIEDYTTASDGAEFITDVVFNDLVDGYDSPNLGGKVWPTVVNLFGDVRPSIVVGTALGGLRILRDDTDVVEDKVSIQVFPNPQQKGSGIKIVVSHPANVKLFSVKGQSLPFMSSLMANQETYIPLFDLSAGVYIIRFEIGNKFYSRKFVVY